MQTSWFIVSTFSDSLHFAVLFLKLLPNSKQKELIDLFLGTFV